MNSLHHLILCGVALIGGIVLYVLGKPEAAAGLCAPVLLLMAQQAGAAKKKETEAVKRADKAERDLFEATNTELRKKPPEA